MWTLIICLRVQKLLTRISVLLGISLLIVLSSCVIQVKKNVISPSATAVSPTIETTPSPSDLVINLGFKVAGWT